MTAANAPISPAPVSSIESERRAHEPSMEEILASIRKIIADDDALPLTRPSAPPRLFESNVTSFAPPPAAPAPEAPVPAAPAVEPEPVASAPEPASDAEVEAARVEARLDEAELESFAEVGRELSKIDEAEAGASEEQGASLRPAFDAGDETFVADEDDAEASPVPHEQPYEEPVAEEPAVSPEPPRFAEAAYGYSGHAAAAFEPQATGGMLSAEANASVASAFQALSASVQMASADAIDRHVREMLRPMLKQWLDDNLPVMVERLVRAEIERVARGGR